MDMHEKIKYIPKTQTVNADRLYYIENNNFIKIDFNIQRGLNEANILKNVKHKYIQEYKNSYIKDEKHFLISSYFEGETLENYKLNKQEKNEVIKQLFNLFSYMLDNNLVHGDINVSNILFNKNQILLIDWETAFKSNSLQDLYGPPWGILDLINKI